MESIEAEVVSEKKRDVRGRRIASDCERERVLTGYAKSGLTQREFARREGIAYATFVGWLGKSRRQKAVKKPADGFVEARLAVGAFGANRLEVALPCGLVVRGHDVAAVAELVKTLGR